MSAWEWPKASGDVLADFVGSTTALLNHVTKSDKQKFIVATESGILHQMEKNNPDKILIPAPPTDETCMCNDCAYMKLNTLQKLYVALKQEEPEIHMTSELIEKAKLPLERMLEISKNLKR